MATIRSAKRIDYKSERAKRRQSAISRFVLFVVLYILTAIFSALIDIKLVLVCLLILLADYILYRYKKSRRIRSFRQFEEVGTKSGILEMDRRETEEGGGETEVIQGLPRGLRGFVEIRRYLLCAKEIGHSAGRVLDVGTQAGILSYRFGLSHGRKFVGLDICIGKEFIEKNLGLNAFPVHGDGEMLPFKDESFDAVIIMETLEHFPKPIKGVLEASRVIKTGGRLVITVPNATYVSDPNLLIVLENIIGTRFDGVLLKTRMPQHTYFDAVSFHWDFSPSDLRRMLPRSMRVTKLYSHAYMFPYEIFNSLPDRYGHKLVNLIEDFLGRLPVVKTLGGHLILVAQKVSH